MNPELNIIIAMILQTRYGLQRFQDEGGHIGLAPGSPETELLVYHPDELPIELRNLLKAFGESVGMIVRFLNTRNFQDYEQEEINKYFKDNIDAIQSKTELHKIAVALGPISVDIFIGDKGATRAQANNSSIS